MKRKTTRRQSLATKSNDSGESMETENKKTVVPPQIDLLPTFLTQLEFETLNLLLFWQTDLTPKYIENVIQTVYIFDRAITISSWERKDIEIDPFLKEFIDLFQNYKKASIEKETAGAKIRQKYFTPDDKMPVEKKRLTLVTEINRIVSKPLAIPSHRAISNALLNLEAHKLIDRKTTITKTFWQINLNFYQHWRECHNQLVAKFEKYKKESKATDKDIDAMKTMLNEYPRILLEFYNIEYWKYFNNEELTSLVLKYREDLMKLTRY